MEVPVGRHRLDVELLSTIGTMTVPDHPELLEDIKRPVDR